MPWALEKSWGYYHSFIRKGRNNSLQLPALQDHLLGLYVRQLPGSDEYRHVGIRR
jgi:hypothetical protein